MTYLSGKALIILTLLSIISALYLPSKATEISGSGAGSQNQNILIGTGECLLHWTAPGDDHNAEPATGYDLRYVPAYAGPIDTEEKWNQATQCQGEPRPSAIGQPDSMLVSGLIPGESYYFCIKSYDEAYNYSLLSNSPLVIANGYQGPFILGDVNNSGDVNGLDVIYLVNYLRGGNPIPDPILRADVNGSCDVNALDATYIRNYLEGGPDLIQGDCGPASIARVTPGRIPSSEALHSGISLAKQ